MTRYAEGTSVPIERSKAEIERLLTKYGADKFISGWDSLGATIGFQAHNRLVRFHIPLPARDAKQFTHEPRYGNPRSPDAALRAWEQSVRQKWRALALVVKAKLEAVDSGVATFEQEFLAHIVLPSQKTVGEWLTPQLDGIYKGKKLPLLLGAGDDA